MLLSNFLLSLYITWHTRCKNTTHRTILGSLYSCDATPCWSVQVHWRFVGTPPSSGLQNKSQESSQQEAGSKQSLAYTKAQIIEAICSSETSTNFYWNTRRHIPKVTAVSPSNSTRRKLGLWELKLNIAAALYIYQTENCGCRSKRCLTKLEMIYEHL